MLQIKLNIFQTPVLEVVWIFDEVRSFLLTFPLELEIVQKLNGICKELHQNASPLIAKIISIQLLQKAVVVKEGDRSLAWFYPDIPWQIFSKVGINYDLSQKGYNPESNLTETAWSLTPYEEGKHICQYETPSWIRENEETSYRFHREIFKTNQEKSKQAYAMASQWYVKCRGWSLKTRRQNYREAVFVGQPEGFYPEKHKNQKLIIKIHNTEGILSEAAIPKHVQRRKNREFKRTHLQATIFSFQERSLKYFLIRDIVEIFPSVHPTELEQLLVLEKSEVKKLIYRRIGEVSRDLLQKLKSIFFPKLICLEGDWNLNSSVEQVFGSEVWHPISSPLSLRDRSQISQEMFYICKFSREYDEEGHKIKVIGSQILKRLKDEYYVFPPNGWEGWVYG